MLAGLPICFSNNLTETAGLALNAFHWNLHMHELQLTLATECQENNVVNMFADNR